MMLLPASNSAVCTGEHDRLVSMLIARPRGVRYTRGASLRAFAHAFARLCSCESSPASEDALDYILTHVASIADSRQRKAGALGRGAAVQSQEQRIRGKHGSHVASGACVGPDREVATGIGLEGLHHGLARHAENVEGDADKVGQCKHGEAVPRGVDEGLNCVRVGGA